MPARPVTLPARQLPGRQAFSCRVKEALVQGVGGEPCASQSASLPNRRGLRRLPSSLQVLDLKATYGVEKGQPASLPPPLRGFGSLACQETRHPAQPPRFLP